MRRRTDVETLHGLKDAQGRGRLVRAGGPDLGRVRGGPEKILRSRLKDKTFAGYKMKRGENKGWTGELFEVNWATGKLWLPKGRRSVLAEEAKVRVRLSA